jgi:hypothetical protein
MRLWQNTASHSSAFNGISRTKRMQYSLSHADTLKHAENRRYPARVRRNSGNLMEPSASTRSKR